MTACTLLRGRDIAEQRLVKIRVGVGLRREPPAVCVALARAQPSKMNPIYCRQIPEKRRNLKSSIFCEGSTYFASKAKGGGYDKEAWLGDIDAVLFTGVLQMPPLA